MERCRGLVDILVKNLIPKSEVIISEEEGKLISNVFNKKISGLKEVLSNSQNEIIYQALFRIESHDWTRLAPSPCHGDMTLENIIIKNDNLFFIDFLDSFYDSWILDIGTLLQDVQVMWSYRFNNEINMNTVLRLIVFRDLLIEEIKKVDKKYVLEVYYAYYKN